MNVEEKVATLEALLSRVKRNAAAPRRTAEVATALWSAAQDGQDGGHPRAAGPTAGIALLEAPELLADPPTLIIPALQLAGVAGPAPVVAQQPAKPPVTMGGDTPTPERPTVEPAKPSKLAEVATVDAASSPAKAETPKAPPVKTEPPKAEPLKTEPPKAAPKGEATKAPAVKAADPVSPPAAKVEPTPKPAPAKEAWLEELSDLDPMGAAPIPVIPATPKAPRAPETQKPPPATTPPAAGKSAAPPRISPTATGSSLPKISPTATGSALPKVSASSAPAGKAGDTGIPPARISATATATGLPKVSPTGTATGLPKVSPSTTPPAATSSLPPAATTTTKGLPKTTSPADEKLPSAVDAPSTDGITKVVPVAEKTAKPVTGGLLDETTSDEETQIALPSMAAIKPAEAKRAPERSPAPPAVKPAETKLAKPVEAVDSKPADTKPAEVKPVEAKPIEVGETPKPDTKPVETKELDAKPLDAKPGVATGDTPKPAEAAHATTETKDETKPAEAKDPAVAVVLVDAKQADAKPVEEEDEPKAAGLVSQPPPAEAPAPRPTPKPQPKVEDLRSEPEITAPSRRYMPPVTSLEEPVQKARSRVGLVAVGLMLVSAGAFAAYHNGWLAPLLHTGDGPGTATVAPPPTSAPSVTSVATAPRPIVVPTATATAVATHAPSATGSAAPATTTTAAASATAAPVTTAPTSTPAAIPPEAGDPAKLAITRGYLVVESPTELGVFLSGNFRGLTGKTLEVDCGVKFVRLAVPPSPSDANGPGIIWKSEGKSANVVCRGLTRMSINPSP